jgi:His Kinase A (phospho-acceptor) domain
MPRNRRRQWTRPSNRLSLTAQDRPVQIEKLTSLGQLTAGIAHQIKNPLNFVSNFSALSAELTDDLNERLKPATLSDKIRAEVDELTGLLKGCASLNLAYHGARAEKRQFNVTPASASGLLTRPIDFTLLREEIDTRLVQEPVKSDATGLDQSLPLSFCLSMIFGQTLRVCPEGKPVSTHRVVARGHAFTDHARTHGLKNAGSLSALIMVSTISAAPWSSRSSRSSHILRKLARIGAFSEGSRSIRVRAMQKAMPSAPIRVCSMVGLLMAGSLSIFDARCAGAAVRANRRR